LDGIIESITQFANQEPAIFALTVALVWMVSKRQFQRAAAWR
jgi:hypothetical protein